MNIRFRTRQLQKACNSRAELKREFGYLAPFIEERLCLLSAADDLGQVPAQKPVHLHQLSRKGRRLLAVDLQPPWQLLFQPIEQVATTSGDAFDLDAIRTIEIVDVVDKD